MHWQRAKHAALSEQQHVRLARFHASAASHQQSDELRDSRILANRSLATCCGCMKYSRGTMGICSKRPRSLLVEVHAKRLGRKCADPPQGSGETFHAMRRCLLARLKPVFNRCSVPRTERHPGSAAGPQIEHGCTTSYGAGIFILFVFL